MKLAGTFRIFSNKTSILFWTLLIVYGISFIYVSNVFPFYRDDLGHLGRIGARYDTAPTLLGIFKNIDWSYHNKVSRMGEFLLFFILSGLWHVPWMWGILNFLSLLSLSCGIFFHVYMRLPSPSKKHDIFITFLLLVGGPFALLAYPGETFFWRSGALNYSWMAGFTLWFLAVFRLYLSNLNARKMLETQKYKYVRYSLFFVFSIFCGGGNENVASVIIGVLAIILFIYSIKYVKAIKHAPFLLYGGFIGFIIGACIMLFAPAVSSNFLNGGSAVSRVSNLFKLQVWAELRHAPQVLMQEFLFIFPAIILLCFSKNWGNNIKKHVFLAAIYFIIGCLSIIILLLVRSSLIARALFGSSVFFLIAGLLLYKGLYLHWKEQKKVLTIYTVVTRLIFSFTIIWAIFIMYFAVMPSYTFFRSRSEFNKKILLTAAQSPQHFSKDVLVDTATGWGSDLAMSFAGQYSMFYLLEESSQHPDNRESAIYYKVKSIYGRQLSVMPPYVIKVALFVSKIRRAGKYIYSAVVRLV